MKVSIETQGCSANFSEGEQIKGIISEKHTLAEKEASDIIILNICTVKGDRRALKLIKELREKYPDKRIMITGCVTDKIISEILNDEQISVVNTKNIDRIEEALDKKIMLTEERKIVKLGLPRKRDSKITGIVQIASGCLDACAYCSTKQTKGALYSFPEEKILEEVRALVEDGCKQIWITAQDTACYGFDTGTNLAELLHKIAELDGDFMVRVGMGNPRHVKKYLDRFAEVMKHPKIYKFVHLPVQSGSNRVLKEMSRGHTVEDYEEIILLLKKEMPEITIATDVIIGYPGETEEDFVKSLELVRRTEPDAVNISRFVARPGTKAAEMTQILSRTVKERSRRMTELFEKIALQRNKNWEGWEGEILIEGIGKNETMVGRNYAYKTIVVKENVNIGEKMKVKLEKADVYYVSASCKTCAYPQEISQ